MRKRSQRGAGAESGAEKPGSDADADADADAGKPTASHLPAGFLYAIQ
jgi:hypothetical protein